MDSTDKHLLLEGVETAVGIIFDALPDQDSMVRMAAAKCLGRMFGYLSKASYK
jgi:hypothetical protein